MKKNEVFEKIQFKILELMKTSGANWTKSWISSGLPINVITDKSYRGINTFWLSIQEFHTNDWATFKQWSSKGYKIKKGSKATPIIFCESKQKKEKWLSDRELKNYRKSGILPYYWLWKTYMVFNGDQIEDYISTSQNQNFEEKLTISKVKDVSIFIDNTSVNIIPSNNSAYYSSIVDEIGMPSIKSFNTDIDYFSTLLHELTHWTGHKARCDRDQSGTFGSANYAKEELIAEIGSAFLCQILGISKRIRKDHAQYLNHWISLIEEDSKIMITAFSKAQKAVDFVQNLQDNKKVA